MRNWHKEGQELVRLDDSLTSHGMWTVRKDFMLTVTTFQHIIREKRYHNAFKRHPDGFKDIELDNEIIAKQEGVLAMLRKLVVPDRLEMCERYLNNPYIDDTFVKVPFQQAKDELDKEQSNG